MDLNYRIWYTPASMAQNIEAARKVLYVPGASVDLVDMINTVGDVYEEEYGEGNVIFMGSPVSAEPSHPKWRRDIASTDKQYGPTGLDKHLTSLGVAQAYISDRRIPGHFKRDDVLENTTVTMFGAAGFTTDIRDRVRYIGEVKDLEVGFQLGLQAMGTFPPPAEQISTVELSTVLHRYSNIAKGEKLSRLAGTPGGFTVLPHDDLVLPNTEFFTPADFDAYRRSNDDLKEAVTKGNEEEAVDIITRRGQTLFGPLRWTYRGSGPEFAKRSSRGDIVVERNWMKNAPRHPGLLLQGIGSQPMRHFQEHDRRGMKINFMVPPFDTLVPIDTIVHFFHGDVQKAQEHTKILPVGSHPIFHGQRRVAMKALRG
jgi:hypothetical protein